MINIALKIYDYFKKHPLQGWSICMLLTVAFIASVSTLHYKEDISDFLPLDETNQTALSVYQDISGANKVYVIVSTRDTIDVSPQELVDGVEAFVSKLEDLDSANYVKNIVKEIDMEQMLSAADIVYENIPYFLTDTDYTRIDSLLQTPGYIDAQLYEDRQMLLFPSSNMLTANISRDPLNLFSPILGRLSGSGASIKYETYDGYILSPDAKKAIIILESVFGAHESENNAKLVDLLNASAKCAETTNSNLDIHIIGGPVIAVANANQIKSDSILAVCIAGILIFSLLLYVFRRIRNILLIVVSVGWGWLMAMGIIALFYSSVSIIVIGIASVILGIAVNYPLHLIDHLKDSSNHRAALKEIISPLVVGNVTTVGAFLCLVPLNASALHDLGLFSSLLLVGTIIFVIVFLPHAIKTCEGVGYKKSEPILISKLANISIENNRWTVGIITILTILFGYFSLKTEFDSDMRNINYMTTEQRSDLNYFQSLQTSKPNTESVYVVSNGATWDDALAQNEVITFAIDSLIDAGVATRHNNVSSFLLSKAEQERRLGLWHKFKTKYADILSIDLPKSAQIHGFSDTAFDSFNDILNEDNTIKDFEYFGELTSMVFVGNVSEDKSSDRKSIVQTIEVECDNVDLVKEDLLAQSGFNGLCFDVKSMNGAIANTLSNDFNYIGFACGFIVFVFLWISLGSIELAIVSFLPMAVSWIWILGLMAILDIRFNIVNVILATFIFGQGDDYTIFMTEGLSYEFAYRKKLLASYKSSIVVSALIMFIGIGTLIFAKHPALRSLGEVTVVGMLSVVLMAYLLPPMTFNWLIRKNGKVRQRPITLKKIMCTAYCAAIFLSQLAVAYIMGFFMFVVTKPNNRKKLFLHKYCCSVFRFDVKRMPGLKFRYDNAVGEDFKSPAVIISNHQSMLDSFYIMFLHPKIIMVANDHVSLNPITGLIFRWLDFMTVGQGAELMLDRIKPFVEQGYSIAVFPEGERPRRASNNIKRFHKGAFQFAEELGIDILPIYLHGVVQAMPKGSAVCHGGEILIKIGNRISPEMLYNLGSTTKDRAQAIKHKYQAEFTHICHQQSTVHALTDIVYDRYRYKGADIERNAKKTLCVLKANHSEFENSHNGQDFLVFDYAGQGEIALLLSLMYPNESISCVCKDTDSQKILKGCLENFVTNVKLISEHEAATLSLLNVFCLANKNDIIDFGIIPQDATIIFN